jgi:hypothetical protein
MQLMLGDQNQYLSQQLAKKNRETYDTFSFGWWGVTDIICCDSEESKYSENKADLHLM